MLHLFDPPTTKIRLAFVVLVGFALAGCASREDRAQSYYQSGMKLLAAHENEKAGIEFRNALKLKKDLVPAWRGLAQTEEATQHWEGLVPALKSILELDPKDDGTRLKLAKLLLLGGAPDQSLKLVNDAGDDTENAGMLALKAVIFYRLKDNSGAVREAQAALKLDPENVDALMVLAADRLASGDAKGALQILDSNSEQRQKDLGVQLFKIRIYEQLKDFAQIESLLRKLAEMYPQQVAFRQQLAKFYMEQHRPQDAEKVVRDLAAANPQNSEFGLELVRFLYAVKGAPAAREELTARINSGGDIFPYQLALAEFDYGKGNFNDSFRLLETLSGDTASPAHAQTAKIKLAELNLARKNTDAAEKIVADILAKDSRNVDALRLRASIRLDRGDLDAAISDLRAALNDQPRSTDLMRMLATAYERSGSIELADKQFADATKVSDFNPNVGLSYVSFLRRRGSADHAFDILTELTNRWPNNVDVLSALAEAKLTRQDWAGAQEIAETLRRIGDTHGIADQILGTALSGRDKYDESIAAFQAAAVASPSSIQPMVALVGAFMRAKQTDKAVGFLQSVLKANPANAEAYVLLGSIQLSINAPDQAIKNFKMAIEKQPKDAIGYKALAELYFGQKKIDAALDVIRSGLKEQPDSSILEIALAGALEQKGDYEAAISEYESLLKAQPGSLIISNNLASMLADHRTDKASLAEAQTLAAILRKSQVPQFKDTLGWVNYRQGDFKAAVPLLEDAASALPNLALVHYHLGMSYVGTGQFAKASEQFKMALAHAPGDELEAKVKGELKNIVTQ